MSAEVPLIVRAVAQTRADVGDVLRNPGDAALIERGRPRWLILKCPCGCGVEIPINLDSRAGPAWRLYKSKKGGVSVYPSVWRDEGCESHFIIWRDVIWLFGGEEMGWTSREDEARQLATLVLKELPAIGLHPYVELAEVLGEVPWDVLSALRWLVKQGKAVEGGGKQRGHFGRK